MASLRLPTLDRQTHDLRVQGTNDDAQVSKLSCVKIGYFEDELVSLFVRRAVRRSPLINRGYYSRYAALRKLLEQFLHATRDKGVPCQVLSLGAGFDTTWFQLQRAGAAPTRYCELDFKEVTQRKAALISSQPELRRLLVPDSPTSGSSMPVAKPHAAGHPHGTAGSLVPKSWCASGSPTTAGRPLDNVTKLIHSTAPAAATAYPASSSMPVNGPVVEELAGGMPAAQGAEPGLAAGRSQSGSPLAGANFPVPGRGAARSRPGGVWGAEPIADVVTAAATSMAGTSRATPPGGVAHFSLEAGEVLSSSYMLLPVDLRCMDQLQAALKRADFDLSLPTYVLSECVLVYLEPAASTAVVDWLGHNLSSAVMVVYEQIKPDDAFGQQMVMNLEARGVPLRGLAGTPTLEAQRQRFLANGWQRAQALDMDAVYKSQLDPQDKSRIERLEVFDEFEEWHLIQQHYCIALGVNDACGQLKNVGFAEI